MFDGCPLSYLIVSNWTQRFRKPVWFASLHINRPHFAQHLPIPVFVLMFSRILSFGFVTSYCTCKVSLSLPWISTTGFCLEKILYSSWFSPWAENTRGPGFWFENVTVHRRRFYFTNSVVSGNFLFLSSTFFGVFSDEFSCGFFLYFTGSIWVLVLCEFLNHEVALLVE